MIEKLPLGIHHPAAAVEIPLFDACLPDHQLLIHTEFPGDRKTSEPHPGTRRVDHTQGDRPPEGIDLDLHLHLTIRETRLLHGLCKKSLGIRIEDELIPLPLLERTPPDCTLKL